MLKAIAQVVGGLVALFVLGNVAIGVFERFASEARLRAWQRRSMPFFRPFMGFGLGWAVVESTGRRTGRPRRVPVGGSLRGPAFWFTAWRGAEYLHNIAADPHVRVRARGRWRTGTASLLPDDDARRRSLLVNPANGLFLWLANRELVTVRVDLDRR
jgi:deazaflavin-dependent oxidoreductase (nitroreductase family)